MSATRSNMPTHVGCYTVTSSVEHHCRPLPRNTGGRLGHGQGYRAGRFGIWVGRTDVDTILGHQASRNVSRLGAGHTRLYMSPEQAEGDLQSLGPRSDVSSLGATIYCILTGRPAFDGDIAAVILAVRKGDFRPPRQLVPAIDPAMRAICMKAMSHAQADRYATPRALAEDIERLKGLKDLDPLRSRPDFRLLMMDQVFPAEPFAPRD
jgi:hypothetical protein